MAKFIIEGGHALKGSVRVSGMKNAATPILAATLLTDEPCVLENVPRIRDVERMIEILQSLGATVSWTGDHTLTVHAGSINLKTLNTKAVGAMRSSILLLGPLVARCHEVTIPEPGGCIIGNRPIDAHILALEQLGATIERTNGSYHVSASTLRGSTVILPEFSVTATENLLMAAVLAEGTTVVHIAAAEPHVQDLVRFLNAMGADIQGAGTHTLTIRGVQKLHGAQHTIIPDQIEAGTFAVAAALTRGKVTIEDVVPEDMELVLLKLQQIGVKLTIEPHGNRAHIHIAAKFPLHAFRLQAFPYPGFPTDLQAPFGVLATQCTGTSLIHDPMYEGRLGYINELIKMGANAVICDPHRVLVTGPTPLYGQEMRSLDLRAGATLVIAGLIAKGETIIHDAEILDRGYEKLAERLTTLGAVIRRVE